MSNGTRLKLDRDHLIQMVKSPDFYLAVPEFIYLKDVAINSWKSLQQQKGCQKCYHEWRAMRGVCDAFFIRLRELKETNSEAIPKIKQWLSDKKGYTVEKCVLYYRRSNTQGKIAKFEF